MKGFRQFAKYIVSETSSLLTYLFLCQNEKSAFPTFDEFKKDFGQTKGESSLKKLKGKPQHEVPHPEEGAEWDKYFQELREKVKTQREKIRRHDQKQHQQRQSSFQRELEMRLMHKIQNKKMVDYQRSMAGNAASKEERLYQRPRQNIELPSIKRVTHTAGQLESAGGTNTKSRKNGNSIKHQQSEVRRSMESNHITRIDSAHESSQLSDEQNEKIEALDSKPALDVFGLTRVQQKLDPSMNLTQFGIQSLPAASNGRSKRVSSNAIQGHPQEESETMFDNYTLKDFLGQINKCKEKEQPIQIKGFGFNSCPYAQMIENEKEERDKNKKDAFHDQLFIQKQLLKGQARKRKYEHQLFEHLKEELEEAQVNDILAASPTQGQQKRKSTSSAPFRSILKNITCLNRKDIEKNIHIPDQKDIRSPLTQSFYGDNMVSTGRALFNLNTSVDNAPKNNLQRRKWSNYG